MAHAERILLTEVQVLASAPRRKVSLDARVEWMKRRMAPLPERYLGEAVRGLLERLLSSAVGSGWSPQDLGEALRRSDSEHLLSHLADQLIRDAARAPVPGRSWLAEVHALGPGRSLAGHSTQTLAAGLALAAVLATLPKVAATVTRTGATAASVHSDRSDQHAKLRTVRALLAKAESTSFPEEAEALTAKAQELISRYALDRLLHQHSATGESTTGIVVRRLWLDRPYVLEKAHLVSEVARANRSRAVLFEPLGMCTLVGEPLDLDSVELLATSLLVQATNAMVGHGRQVSHSGVARTRSFRRAFLLSFAGRIGERLQQATARALEEHGGSGVLVPVVHQAEERVTQAFQELYPTVRTKASEITNLEGWAAGRVAADLAQLDVHARLPDASGP